VGTASLFLRRALFAPTTLRLIPSLARPSAISSDATFLTHTAIRISASRRFVSVRESGRSCTRYCRPDPQVRPAGNLKCGTRSIGERFTTRLLLSLDQRVFLKKLGHSCDQCSSSKRLLDEKCLLNEFVFALLVIQITANVNHLDLGLQGFQPLGEF
jgi:hypothetical protein